MTTCNSVQEKKLIQCMRSRLETFFINVPGCANHQLCSFHVALARAALLVLPASPAVIISFSTRFCSVVQTRWRRTERFLTFLFFAEKNVNWVFELHFGSDDEAGRFLGKSSMTFVVLQPRHWGLDIALFLQCRLDSWSASSLEIWCTHVSSVLINGYETTGRCYGSMS